jgi:hypothetical protein
VTVVLARTGDAIAAVATPDGAGGYSLDLTPPRGRPATPPGP